MLAVVSGLLSSVVMSILSTYPLYQFLAQENTRRLFNLCTFSPSLPSCALACQYWWKILSSIISACHSSGSLLFPQYQRLFNILVRAYTRLDKQLWLAFCSQEDKLPHFLWYIQINEGIGGGYHIRG